jgi:putative GTP pyrophosphokinase
VALSKTQVDRLGDRLKEGEPSEADLRLLDEYRRSFGEVYDFVVSAIRNDLHLEPTGRPAKSTKSIVDKLRRESIRLSQIQDIAGCRLLVTDLDEQDRVTEAVATTLKDVAIVDRREKPSHGYRAVHVVVRRQEVLVEIQVRTVMQHLWAESSEKFSDVVDIAIKYGGGNAALRFALDRASSTIALFESSERKVARLPPDHPEKRRLAAAEEYKRDMQAIIEDIEKLR